MTFEFGFAEGAIEERVMQKPGVLDLLRRKIQSAFEDAEGFLFRKRSHSDKVTDLHYKAANLLQERGVPAREVAIETHDLPFGRNPGTQVGERGFGMFR